MKRILISLALIVSCLVGAAQVVVFMPVYGGSGGGGGGTYSVLRTVRLNAGSQFATSPTSPWWNTIGVDGTVIQTDNNYTSAALKTELNVATTWTVSIPNHWLGTTGSLPTPPTIPSPRAANSGIYRDEIEQSGFVFDGSFADPSIQLNNLDPTKWYQVHILSNVEGYNSGVGYWYSGAIQTASISMANNVGFSTDNEFTISYIGHLKNLQCDGTGHLLIKLHKTGGFAADLNAVVIQETNIANPN